MDTYSRINLIDRLQRKIFILLLFVHTFLFQKGDLVTRFSHAIKASMPCPLQLEAIRIKA
jgi:hypothetical protein